MRPKGITSTALAMGVLNLGGLVGLRWDHHLSIGIILSLMAVGYIVLWFYWIGQNWARWLVIVTSALAILNLIALRSPLSPRLLYGAMIIAEALLGAFLLYWLNTPRVRERFRSTRIPTSHHDV